MNHWRPRIRRLCLGLLAASCLTALTATSAQAGEFRIGGGTMTAKGIASETINGSLTAGDLLVGGGGGGLNLQIHCEGGSTSGTISKGGSAQAAFLLSGCYVVGNANCIIYPAENEFGTAGEIFIEGSGTLVLSGFPSPITYIVFSGTNLGTVYFSGAKCALPEENELSGSFGLRFGAGEHVIETLSDLASVLDEILGTKLLLGGDKAEFDNLGASVSLAGANTGNVWGAE